MSLCSPLGVGCTFGETMNWRWVKIRIPLRFLGENYEEIMKLKVGFQPEKLRDLFGSRHDVYS